MFADKRPVVFADRRPVVFAGKKPVVLADAKSVVFADKRSVVCQDIPMVWTIQGRPPSVAAPVWSIELGCLGRPQISCLQTQRISCLRTQPISCLQTQQISCLQKQQMPKIAKHQKKVTIGVQNGDLGLSIGAPGAKCWYATVLKKMEKVILGSCRA